MDFDIIHLSYRLKINICIYSNKKKQVVSITTNSIREQCRTRRVNIYSHRLQKYVNRLKRNRFERNRLKTCNAGEKK